ncbi:hypothetical protein T11_6902 [Trichinella zimbabwensis]|uniref:Uncharacterized protein n=1 Tax=Trichinella zimbabwensis TaxID=268475 RepID=A0A0V1HWV9_9BILA|nr:hypothetical protein T11_6902 [Trichinella zimbabwensis]
MSKHTTQRFFFKTRSSDTLTIVEITNRIEKENFLPPESLNTVRRSVNEQLFPPISGQQPTTFTGNAWTDGNGSIKYKYRQTNSTIPSSFHETGFAGKYVQKGVRHDYSPTTQPHSSSNNNSNHHYHINTTIANPTAATYGRSCDVSITA